MTYEGYNNVDGFRYLVFDPEKQVHRCVTKEEYDAILSAIGKAYREQDEKDTEPKP